MATEPTNPEGIANKDSEVLTPIEVVEEPPKLLEPPKHAGGRPKGVTNSALSQTELREYIRAYYGKKERLDQILETGLKIALGLVSVYDGMTDEGKPTIYTVPPDKQAWYRICELLGGKATQPIDHSGEISNPQIESVAEQTRIILEKLSEKK